MAIYWVDPYIDSTNGGIHGTTGSGSGTYASPYTLTWNGAGLSSGDEIRLKGLSESSFWSSTGNSFQVTEYQSVSGQDQYYYGTGGASLQNKHVRVRTDQTQQLLRFRVYGSYIETRPFAAYGDVGVPILDKTYGYDLFNEDYATNSTAYNGFLTSIGTSSSASDKVTLTAGWTSETVQGGVTILAISGMYIGQQDLSSAYGQRLNIDARDELVVMSHSSTQFWRVNELKMLSCFPTTGGSYWYITKSIDVGASGIPSSLYFYNNQSAVTTNTFTADFLSNFTNGTFYFFSNKSSGSTTHSMTLKEIMVGAQVQITGSSGGGHLCDVTNATDYYRVGEGTNDYIFFQDSSNIGIGTYTDTASTTITYEFSWDSAAHNEVYLGPKLTSSSTGERSTIYSPINLTFNDSDNVWTVGVVDNANYMHARVYAGMDNTDSLETIDKKIAECSVNTSSGIPLKLTVLADGESSRPFQMMYSSNATTVGYPVFVFRSPTFSDKTVWHFTSHSNGGIYADTFAIDLPSYAGGDLTFDCSFTTSSSPGVTVKATLYTINSDGVDSNYGQQTASGSGTSLSISQTISQSTLTTNDAQSAYVILEITKTDTTVSNVAIDSIGLS